MEGTVGRRADDDPADQDRWTAVDDWLTGLLVGPDPVLDAALQAGAAAGLPAHEVSSLQGALLALLARLRGARRILELGTLGGCSTIWLARTLPAGGRLVTLESDPRRAGVARAAIAEAGFADIVDLLLGPALETLPRLVAEGAGPFDLVFVDADKRSNPEYLRWALELAAPGTLIVADNVVRDGAVLDPSDGDPAARGARRFIELLAAEPRVTATVIQTVGAKGYDGFALALVVEEIGPRCATAVSCSCGSRPPVATHRPRSRCGRARAPPRPPARCPAPCRRARRHRRAAGRRGLASRLLLVDKSAYVRGRIDAADDDDLCVCAVTRLELLYSARSRADYHALEDDLAHFRELRMDAETFAIALAAQRELAAGAGHRVPIPDLLIASCAHQHGADVMHVDRHYDGLAEVLAFTSLRL